MASTARKRKRRSDRGAAERGTANPPPSHAQATPPPSRPQAQGLPAGRAEAGVGEGTPTAGPSLRRLVGRLAGAESLFTSLAALVTVVGAVLGLVFFVWPQLRPDPAPAALGATLGPPKVEPGVALGDYLARAGDRLATKAPNLGTFTEEHLRHPGAIVTFRVVIEGYEGEPCVVRWSMHDAATGARLAGDPRFVDQFGFPDKYLTATATRDQLDAETWVPVPPEPGPYFVRLELSDPDGVRLDSVDTPPFAGAPGQAPGPRAAADPRPTVVLTPPSFDP